MSVPVDRRPASRAPRVVLPVAAIACLGAILAQPASAAPERTRTLVIKEANNPVFKALKRTTRLSVDRSPPRGGRHGGKHDLLVLDGDALSARRMARRRELKDFANGGRWVLALDVGSRHHRRALAKHTGFEALAEGEHRSRSFLFRHTVVDGVPRTLMLDTKRLRPTGTHSVGPRQRRKSTRKEVKRVAGMIADRLEASDGELAQAAGVAHPSAPQGADVPDEALRVGFNYAVTGSNHPRNGAFACGDTGYQVATWTMNHNFTVYLDNSVTHPQGEFQIVTYDLSGSFNPVGQGSSFYNMTQTCTLAGGAQVPRDRSWWTGLLDSSVAPADTPTDGKLTWQANQPSTPNREGTASSEETFTVGIATEGTEGTINATYTADHGKSFTIPDWGVISNTSGNRASWEFSSRHKCDPRSSSDPINNCFGADVTIGYPNYPNDLSRGQIQVDTSARWRTKQLLDRGNGTLAFNVDTPVTLFDIACPSIDFNICGPGGRTVDNYRTGPSPQKYSFDASDAVPVPITSVDLDPTSANGAKNQKVTGTVTLESPSPFTTKVVIFSSKENAVVGQPVSDQITQGTATINKGDTKGTFTIQTNDNHLPTGRRVTAYITAFYGDAFDPVPLVVTSQP